jgi:class 3 adenylate cyclase
MPTIKEFKFDRSRGVVWVCDLSDLSEYLNDDDSANILEEFLPRLHWTAVMVVESAGGRFIKWTGDGFLAWFETSLHRDRGKVAAAVLNAAWHLTFLVNVTQLGLSPGRKFHIRHGITYEHDALLVKIIHTDGHESLDVIGRAVVLAFRICGIEASFPNIVTHRELVDASTPYRRIGVTFQKKKIKKEERLRFFKGHDWQTKQIFVSAGGKRKPTSMKAIVNKAKEVIAKAEGLSGPSDENSFSLQFVRNMMLGPKWCREVISEETEFVREGPLALAKEIVLNVEKINREESLSQTRQPDKTP